MARRQFNRKFKLEAVRLVREQGMTVAGAARDLGLNDNVLRRWIRQFEDDPKHAFPGHGSMRPEQEEIVRLKRELKKAERDRCLLLAESGP